MLRRPPFNRSRLRLHLLPSVCFGSWRKTKRSGKSEPNKKENKMSKNKPAEIATNKPAHEIRINGIRATIWKNETEKGPRYNTTFERSYKDGEEWKTSDSYGREDLLLLAYMAREAFAWIAKQPTK